MGHNGVGHGMPCPYKPVPASISLIIGFDAIALRDGRAITRLAAR